MVWWVFCSVSLMLFPSSIRWSLGVCFSKLSGCLCLWAAGSLPSARGLFSWVFSCGFLFYVYVQLLLRDRVASDLSFLRWLVLYIWNGLLYLVMISFWGMWSLTYWTHSTIWIRVRLNEIICVFGVLYPRFSNIQDMFRYAGLKESELPPLRHRLLFFTSFLFFWYVWLLIFKHQI